MRVNRGLDCLWIRFILNENFDLKHQRKLDHIQYTRRINVLVHSQLRMPKCHRCLPSYSIVFLFVLLYLIISGVMIMFLKSVDLKQDIKPWDSLLTMYPGLVEPIQATWNDPLSIRKIYMITPTKTRAEQIADLTRLAQTLYLIPNLFWIIVEDEPQRTKRLHRLLQSFHISFIHLNIATPDYYKPTQNQSTWRRPRGVFQKNVGLEWLRKNTKLDEDALVYFADDDNTYHWKLFQEIRKVQQVGVWPVGLVGELLYERPICFNGKVHSWFHYIYRKRKFATDMAGFAIHLSLIHQYSNYIFNVSSNSIAEQESQILNTMTKIDQLECLANNASKIYVWHTKTQPMFLTSMDKLKNAGMMYDLIGEF